MAEEVSIRQSTGISSTLFFLRSICPVLSAPRKKGNSNVPAQSLTLMNDPLVSKLANTWAQKNRQPGKTPASGSNKWWNMHMEKILQRNNRTAPLCGITGQHRKMDQRAWADLGARPVQPQGFFLPAVTTQRLWLNAIW